MRNTLYFGNDLHGYSTFHIGFPIWETLNTISENSIDIKSGGEEFYYHFYELTEVFRREKLTL